MQKKKSRKAAPGAARPIWIWVILGLVVIGIGAAALVFGRPASTVGEDGEKLPNLRT